MKSEVHNQYQDTLNTSSGNDIRYSKNGKTQIRLMTKII